jgi:hypothetical protein
MTYVWHDDNSAILIVNELTGCQSVASTVGDATSKTIYSNYLENLNRKC